VPRFEPPEAKMTKLPARKSTKHKSTSTRLTDTQLIVLSRAAQREDGVATLPEGMTEKAAQKLAAMLVGRELIREIMAKPGMPVWKRSEEGRSQALIITKRGRTAIKVEDDRESEDTESGVQASASTDKVASAQSKRNTPRQGSKLSTVIDLLGGKKGAGIEELTAATGWPAHHARCSDGIAKARLRDRTRALGEGRFGLPDRHGYCIRPCGLRPWARLHHGSRW
jgi:hypothetical protein